MAGQVVTVSILKGEFTTFREELKEVFKVFRVDLVREIREETKALIAASENRMMHRMDGIGQRLEQKIEGTKLEIIEFIDESILPQIAEHDTILIKHGLKVV